LVYSLHALCKYLVNMGVTVLLVNELATVAGESYRVTEVGASYLADNILMLRYLERDGEIGKALGVLKKRMSDFDKAMRPLEISGYGLKVGPPLRRLRGIFSGSPEWLEE
jgi:circadian clock protein KaiC